MARPRKKIDPEQVRTLAKINCTMIEIAAVVGCSVDTLERRFADVIKECREQGRMSLRRAQWKKALEGHPTMLIWLGKQELGQKDQQAIDIDFRDVSVLTDAELDERRAKLRLVS